MAKIEKTNGGCLKTCLETTSCEVTKIDRHFFNLTGYSKDEIIGKKTYDVFHRLFGMDLSNYTFEDGSSCFLFTRPGKALEVTITKRLTDTGSIYIFESRTEGLLADRHTIAIQQAEIMHEKNKQYEVIFDNITDALFITNGFGRYTMLNKTAKNFFNNTSQIVDIEDAFRYTRYYNEDRKQLSIEEMPPSRLMRNEEVRQMRMIIDTPSGEMFVDTSGSTVRDSCGNIEMMIMCSRDVTDKVKYQELLSNQYEHFCNIIDVMDLPFICLSYPDLNVIKFNKKASTDMGELFCCNLDDSGNTGMDLLTLLPCMDEIREKFSKMVSEKSTEHVFKLELDRNDGKIYYNLVFQPVLDYRKEIAEVLIIGIDITNEIRKMEYIESILRMKDEFLSMISHEFKTPLCVINAAIQAMEVLCHDELTDKIRDYIDKIRHNSFRQLRLVNNLLDVTRANSVNIKINRNNIDIVSLTRAIAESVKLYASQKGLMIFLDCNVKSQIVGMDEEKYERILLNLLSNSIKFTQPGKNIRIGLDMEKSRLLLRVQDEGIGIPKDKQVLIFERFGQVDSTLSRQAEGTGIGLSLVKSMVDVLGGEISVESEIGKGSIFSLKLPCEKCLNQEGSDPLSVQIDNRLIQATAIEFSDIYLYNR